MRATNTIPIVVAACNDDMVETGIIASLAHPGGNVTGLSKMTPELSCQTTGVAQGDGARSVPRGCTLGPRLFSVPCRLARVAGESTFEGVTLQSFEARNVADIDGAFAAIVEARADAVITFSDTLTYNFANQVADLASRNRLPLMSPFQEVAIAGGLMSYGPSIPDLFRRAAGYVDKF